jgi:hypothetical protein
MIANKLSMYQHATISATGASIVADQLPVAEEARPTTTNVVIINAKCSLW